MHGATMKFSANVWHYHQHYDNEVPSNVQRSFLSYTTHSYANVYYLATKVSNSNMVKLAAR